MDRTSVTSSNIASVGYDTVTWVLEVEFKNGGVYHYAFVPPERYASLLRANSLGSFLHTEIKPNHLVRKIDAVPAMRASVDGSACADCGGEIAIDSTSRHCFACSDKASKLKRAGWTCLNSGAWFPPGTLFFTLLGADLEFNQSSVKTETA